jgi:hypothetical protein
LAPPSPLLSAANSNDRAATHIKNERQIQLGGSGWGGAKSHYTARKPVINQSILSGLKNKIVKSRNWNKRPWGRGRGALKGTIA